MTNGETTPQGDASEPAPDPEANPGPWDEPGDPGDFPVDLIDRGQWPDSVETREGDPGDFSSDRMSTEE